MADLPPALLHSITWDQGTEMARDLAISRTLGVPVYFCASPLNMSAGQSNENMTASARQPSQGGDLRTYKADHLLAVENELITGPELSSTTVPQPSSDARLTNLPESVHVRC